MSRNRYFSGVTYVTFRPTTERALALLRGRHVTAPFPRGSAVTVVEQKSTTRSIHMAAGVLVYRKLRKPALRPVGDRLDDVGALT